MSYETLSLFQQAKDEDKMDAKNFPIEFNNELDDVKKSENEFYTLAVDRLSKLAEGHNDISDVVVEVKGAHMIDDPVVQAKKEFAEQMAVASGMKYGIIADRDIASGQVERHVA